MADGQVIFEISGDSRQIVETLRRVTQEIERNGRDWDDEVDRHSDNMQRAFNRAFDVNRIKGWALDAGKAILGFAKDAVQAASDLEEVQNVVDTTFGSSAGQIDAWAKNAIKQFGLTETQAKRFTSTIGAMAKSAGVVGPELVEMSTDIAGLAADMASFYNLDFDEAFQKLRSGISGETEPLKQLGINMSVANLNAYALAQGLEKTFEQMDQAEQTMLRYQYIMQATSDAQGDFARTSDGLANGTRLLESNIESLKTKLGALLEGPVAIFVSTMNGLIDTLFPSNETHHTHTVLDDFAQIDTETNKKIGQIKTTADKALALVRTLNDISGETAKSEGLMSMVDSLSGHFTGMQTAMEAAKNGDYAGTISGIAGALALDTGADATKWEDLLTAIGTNLGTVTNAVGTDGEQTKKWLEAAADAANDLGGEYPALWDDLVSTLGSDAAAEMVKNFAGATEGKNKMEALAEAANSLEGGSAGNWSRFLTAMQNVTGITNLFGGNADSASQNIRDLAGALSDSNVDTNKAEAWQTFLGALSENADGLTDLTGLSAEETKAWLDSMSEAANAINPEDADAWARFLGLFMQGLPGLEGTEGEGAMQALLGGVGSVAAAAENAMDYLSMFGIESTDIAGAEEQWLEVCRRLVKEIPSLSEIINTQTGEVKGGTKAIKDYIEEWKNAQIDMARVDAIHKRQEELADEEAELLLLDVDRAAAQNAIDIMMERFAKRGVSEETVRNALAEYNSGDELRRANAPVIVQHEGPVFSESTGKWDMFGTEYLVSADELQMLSEYQDMLDAANTEYSERHAALDRANVMQQAYERTLSDTIESVDAATEAEEAYARSVDESRAAIEAATEALQAMEAYAAKVREETDAQVRGVIHGFESMETPAEQARKKIKDLKDTITDANGQEVSVKIADLEEAIPTIGNMTAALKEQAEYMEQYQRNLAAAQAAGVSQEMLAELGDGSMESADYLAALAQAAKEAEESGDYTAIEQLNAAWDESQRKREEFTDSLASTKLDADEQFQSLAQSATDAIAELDQYSEADAAMQNTVQGIADGIAAKIPAVQAEVDALNAVLATLAGLSALGIAWTPTAGVNMSGHSKGGQGGWLSRFTDGSHALGLDYVPFDNYLAQLHEGESILTAEEARVWRNFKSGGASTRNNIDYGALSGAIWDSAPAMGGGNVYLDGRTVGRVISGAQADSYRALERSGWQA